MDDYYSHPALSHSRLKSIAKSPAHFRWALDHPIEGPALAVGSLLHALVLEPHTVAGDFACLPKIDRRTKVGKQAAEDFAAEHEGKVVVSEQDWSLAERMRDSVESHSVAAGIIAEAVAMNQVEKEYFWMDSRGFERKGKIDAELRGSSAFGLDCPIIDLKTTVSAGPEFRKSIMKFGYHTQGAYYRDAVRSEGREPGGFIIIAVEKTPPHGVGTFVIDEVNLDQSQKIVDSWLDTYNACRLTDDWPSYEDVRWFDVPDWLMKENGIATD
jgi:exodeoxyribonuclease VIII